MWSFLQAEDQQVHMDSKFTPLIAIVQAIQGGWQCFNRIQDA
jgi:hypothetical protein